MPVNNNKKQNKTKNCMCDMHKELEIPISIQYKLWFKSARLKAETEKLEIAAQDSSLPIRNY